jgi:hypothetical protein
MMPMMSWFYGSVVLFALLVVVVAALAVALTISLARSTWHKDGGNR